MATRIVGNNHRGTYHTWNNVDNEEPNATLCFEDAIVFTPHVLAYPLYGNITAYYYKYHDDVGVEDAYPVLYADNNGQPGEKLTKDEPLMRTSWWGGDREGWAQAVVPMRRTVRAGEKVWFAFFGFMIAPRYDVNPVQTIWISWWESGVSIDSAPTERVGRVELETWRPNMRLSMYFTYSDVAPSIKYVRRITDIARSTSRVGLRWRYGRLTKPCLVGGSDNIQRVQTFVRKCSGFCRVVSFFKRQHRVFRKQTSRVRGSSKVIKNREFFRRMTSLVSGSTTLSKRRELLLKIVSRVDGFSALSNTRDFLLKMASIASVTTTLTNTRKFLRKMVSHISGNTSLSNSREFLRRMVSRVNGISSLSNSRELLRKTVSYVTISSIFSNNKEFLRRMTSHASGTTELRNNREFLRRMASYVSGATELSNSRDFLRKMASRVTGSTQLRKSRELLLIVASYASGFTELYFVHGIGALVRSLVSIGDKLIHWRVISLVVRTLCGVWERFFRRKGVHRVEIVLYSPITLELKLGKK